ncbi:MAG TPA: putative toxin-antitoxin system toxin component, PIN family [Verrucomicrobiae bacterium]|nr:putative toxin-antitoxin system toxin component, PIN family [Verrucomicrobiae bacterium]
MRVVLDANVVFAGAGWRGEAHNCLVAMARRRITGYATDDILCEVRGLILEIGFKTMFSPQNVLNWYYDQVELVEPAPLGRQRSRDAKDDPYLACALGAGAKLVVTRDDDLLALGKPFGIQIRTPRELLHRLSKPV